MKTMLIICAAAVALALSCNAAHAADRGVADSLAMSGAAFAAKGDNEHAKDMLYKALANDENCPEAIFELAKIFEKENSLSAAGDFYQRALVLMGQENKPTTAAKRAEADRRVKALNPFAPRMSGMFEEYAADLDKLVKRVPDTITQDAATARVNELKLTNVISAEKMPKFIAETTKPKAETKKNGRFPSSDSSMASSGGVSPEIERELKSAGWATITGSWTKKAPGVYEVTNGKLEAPKTNGAVDVWVHKGITDRGGVRAAVRNDFSGTGVDFSSSMSSSSRGDYSSSEYAGYGVVIKPKEFRLYAPGAVGGFYSSTSTYKWDPCHIKSENLPDSNPKNHVMVSIMDGVLLLSVNEKQSLRWNNKNIPTAGPFVIEVRGTATIENPRCVGQ